MMSENLYIGNVIDFKMDAFSSFGTLAHLARDEDLLCKAMEGFEKFTGECKMERVGLRFKILQRDLMKWSSQLKSKNAPKKDEIKAFFFENGDWELS